MPPWWIRPGLAAPLAWTGAAPGAERWTLLQYVLYGPLMVAFVGLRTWLLLRAGSPGTPRRWVWWRTWLTVVLSASQDPSGGCRVLGCASGQFELTVEQGTA